MKLEMCWATSHGGMSGRVARQFVTDLAGQIMLSQSTKKIDRKSVV